MLLVIFSNKCPYKKNKGNKEYESKKKKKIQKGRRNKNYFLRQVSAPRKTIPH
jgi:hypothetical protein